LLSTRSNSLEFFDHFGREIKFTAFITPLYRHVIDVDGLVPIMKRYPRHYVFNPAVTIFARFLIHVFIPSGWKNQGRSTKPHEASRKDPQFELFRVLSWIV